MNGTRRNFMRRVALGFGLFVVIGTIAGRAEGAPIQVGDVLATVDLPAAAQCGGTAVAVVPGAKFGFPKIPVLLVTSCGVGLQAQLFFLDPSTNPATLVQSQTNPLSAPVPTGGSWGALTYRADQTDLLACTAVNNNSSTAIYSIDFAPAPFNNVPDGTTTLLTPTAVANTTCNGLSWDLSNVTANGVLQPGALYLSPSTGTQISRVVLPSSTTTISSGCTNSVIAVGVAGRSLFVVCPPTIIEGPTTIQQLDKTTGAAGAAVRAAFNAPTSNPTALTADPVSLGTQFKDILWSRDPNTTQLKAVYIPAGTISQALGAPLPFPISCPATHNGPDGLPLDTDGDGLPDCWEDGTLWSDGLPGITVTGNWGTPGPFANRDLTLCVDANDVTLPGVFTPALECASKNHKDLFVEIDWMGDAVAGFSHNPDVTAPNAIPNVVAAFANAPVTNPDNLSGIRLHVQRSDQIPEVSKTALTPCTPAPAVGDANFDALKAQFFGTQAERNAAAATPPNFGPLNAKSFAYRYGLFVHNQSGALNTSSGCAELGGNDFMVSLGSWGPFNFGTAKKPIWHNVGTLDQQSATFMHELGHTLNLRHGGGDNINCKPNYASLMNYTLQFASPINNRPLDYSRQTLSTLNKTSLSESQGVGGAPPSGKVAFGPVAAGAAPIVVSVPASGGPIDWNHNGVIDGSIPLLDINQTTDLTGGCPPSQGTVLEGYNDWANIQYSVLASFDQVAGAKSTQEQNKKQGTLDIQLDEALELSLDRIDIKPNDPNNTINTGSNVNVSVAIFSRGGDAPLDATTVDPSTVTLRGTNEFTWVVPVQQTPAGFQCRVIDPNADGLPDLVCQFNIPKGTISSGEKKAVLDGATFGGQPVHAADFIKTQ
jgi:hypothetical protein